MNKSFMHIFLLTLLCLPLLACNGKSKNMMDDKLSILKKEYIGDQLRIDGFYYNYYNDKIHNVSFFYRDGTTLNCGGSINDFEGVSEYLNNQFLISKVHKKNKIGWGLFIIQEKRIEIERWYPSQKPYRTYVRAGEILNDTTFYITEIFRVVNGKKTEVRKINEIYHFKQFNLKPDSLNLFIR